MSDIRPAIIYRYWYSIDWSVRDLWTLDLPKTRLPMESLTWHLDFPVWPDADGQPYRGTPRQVVEQRQENAVEFARVQQADLAYPIEAILRGTRWMILDGIHRMTKAWLDGADHMTVRVVPESAVQQMQHPGSAH